MVVPVDRQPELHSELRAVAAPADIVVTVEMVVTMMPVPEQTARAVEVVALRVAPASQPVVVAGLGFLDKAPMVQEELEITPQDLLEPADLVEAQVEVPAGTLLFTMAV